VCQKGRIDVYMDMAKVCLIVLLGQFAVGEKAKEVEEMPQQFTQSRWTVVYSTQNRLTNLTWSKNETLLK